MSGSLDNVGTQRRRDFWMGDCRDCYVNNNGYNLWQELG